MEVLRRVLQRCREYKLKMNPMKCAFGVMSGKFLDYLVNRQAFAKIKETLANAPVMMAPIAGKELKLYLAFNDNAIGVVLAQDDQNGQEKPIDYASRILKEAEAR